jgi:hypothetical protein
VDNYVNQWIVNIEDITNQVPYIYELAKMNKLDEAYHLLPEEKVYVG